MIISTFRDIATLYEKSTSATITRHRIEHPALGSFCISLERFSSMLGELALDEYWRKFLIPLKRIRFGLCATPFTEAYHFERISAISGELQHHLRLCQKLYPDFTGPAFAILDLLTKLLAYPQDPLLDKLLELTGADQEIAWVIKESRLISRVEELVGTLHFPHLSIVHPLQLKDSTCYDRLIVIGPSRWFPESIFTAARAGEIDIVIFDWIKDIWKPQNVFVSPHKSSGRSNRKNITIEECETSSRWDGITAESLAIIFEKGLSVASTLDRVGQNEYEDVVAKCFFLEDDWAVFVEASEGAKTLVIDPEEDMTNPITRISVKEIKPGMYILVRTGGGGDYIVPVADKLMGSEAQHAREYQKRWKELLRNYARRNGLLETSIELLDLGSVVANEVNVRNWMSPRSIRTQKYGDFLAIMRLVGLEDQAQEYWTVMKRINRAHQKAGFEIRNLLLEQVKDLNMEELQKRGKVDFKLSSDDEGGLTAFRVESMLPETVEVPYFQIGQPFRLEDRLWHE